MKKHCIILLIGQQGIGKTKLLKSLGIVETTVDAVCQTRNTEMLFNQETRVGVGVINAHQSVAVAEWCYLNAIPLQVYVIPSVVHPDNDTYYGELKERINEDTGYGPPPEYLAISKARELGKEHIGYNRHVKLVGESAANNVLFHWLAGFEACTQLILREKLR